MHFPLNRNVFQGSWVVDDIEEAVIQWAEQTGIGPFFVTDYQTGELQDTTYRGRPAELTMKTALAQAGDMQIELVQPTGDGPSAYRDTVPEGGSGFHHIATWSGDVAADITSYTEKGFAVAASGNASGLVQFAYIDTSALFGHMIEIVEDNEIIRSVFQAVADAAIDWDGSDPIRTHATGS